MVYIINGACYVLVEKDVGYTKKSVECEDNRSICKNNSKAINEAAEGVTRMLRRHVNADDMPWSRRAGTGVLGEHCRAGGGPSGERWQRWTALEIPSLSSILEEADGSVL
jgi:hypothetical protein